MRSQEIQLKVPNCFNWRVGIIAALGTGRRNELAKQLFLFIPLTEKGKFLPRKSDPLCGAFLCCSAAMIEWERWSKRENKGTQSLRRFILILLMPLQLSSVLSKAILIGIGTFTATGLILLGGQYLHQKYRHHRDLQLIQQSDTLFSSTQSPSSLPCSLLTLR